MQRSNCEAGNVQFVQELAEVDGPFEAPININFRDLTKLELPALVWNRSDSCPRKMKITNTGHTVIVSAKWKCERPYLTGGPLLGKYVFSQIHFHWGQTDCKGSEHQICGEQFPLEMHVAHFKTDYVTQESALREKDGMVIIVYLFKLQEEPNHSLRRIINSLPRVKQPSTSYSIDPRPIVSLCHPFTEDYFMYWGSVVTSTCAHILLWIICREPFGISKEQVSEFRKIMDSSQQPICKNNREVQPLHKRNVFHVNASKHLDNPLLPIKKRLGCYCKETNDCNEAFDARESCHCQGAYQNQEDVEGSFPEPTNFEGTQIGHSCFVNQTFVVQTATVGSLSMVLKRSGSDPVKNHSSFGKLKKVKSDIHNKQVKIMSKSCCFFPPLETKKIDNLNEKRKVREKTKLFQSVKGFSQVMRSLEILKNQTFKKLKKIESINQEIKEMKPFCQDKEDKRWIRKIEKMIMREKRFTIKSSQECMSELKKLAKNCNLDDYFDPKALPPGISDPKTEYPNDNTTATAPYESFYENEAIRRIGNQSSKHSDIGKIIDFSSEAQALIQSFFEDIKDTDDLEETMTKDPNYQKIKSLCSLVGDSKSVSPKNKGYITQKMFNLGNLGDRFFTEITTEDLNTEETWVYDMQNESPTTPRDVCKVKPTSDCVEIEKLSETNIESRLENEEVIPLHRVDIPILLRTGKEKTGGEEPFLKDAENQTLSLKKTSKKIHLKKSTSDNEEKYYEETDENFMSPTEAKALSRQSSSLNYSTDSTDNKKAFKPKKNKRKSSLVFKISSRKLGSKTSLKRFENIHAQKKNLKSKEKKNHRDENVRYKTLYGVVASKSTQEKMETTVMKVESETCIISSKEFMTEEFNDRLTPERKCLTARLSKEVLNKINTKVNSATIKTRTPILDSAAKLQKVDFSKPKRKYLEVKESKKILLKESYSEEQQSTTFESTENESRTCTNRTYEPSSVDSKTRDLKRFEDKQFLIWHKNPTLIRETPRFLEGKPSLMTNCRSLTNITVKPKAEFTQRLQLESIDRRKKTNADAFAETLKESYKSVKESVLEAPNETHKNLHEERERRETVKGIEIQEKWSKPQIAIENDLDFSTEIESQANDEFPPKVQVNSEKEKNTARKLRVPRRSQFLEKGTDEPFKISRPVDSDKPSARSSLRGEENFKPSDNKNFQTSISCSTIKKGLTSRPHSAETLYSLKKTQKRKSKKRPHCSKRNSKHYIRKNHSVFKKPSKQFNFLNLTDEEQLKIISVNVAKYIKQKLLDQKNPPETVANSFTANEKEFKKLSTPEKKPEEPPPKESPAPSVDPQKTKKLRIPVLKSKERTKEKKNDTMKPNTAESQSEGMKPKAELNQSQRPVSNFIKLNKQMAGTYRRTTATTPTLIPVPTSTTATTVLKKLESKEKAKKTSIGTKPPSKISKPKTKIQKKTKEKPDEQKPPEPSPETQTLPQPTTKTPPPKEATQKEKKGKKKSSVTSKKLDSNPKTNKPQTPSQKLEKPDKDVEVKSKQDPDSEKAVSPPKTPKEIPRPKKCLVPASIQESNAEASAEPKILDEKNLQCEVIKQDIKENAEKMKSEILFKKELEYFIAMQMYLNNGLSPDFETPLHCENSSILNSVNTLGEGLFSKDSLQNLDIFNKDIIVVKKNLVESSSSSSQLTEPPLKFIQEKSSTDEKDKDSPKNNNNSSKNNNNYNGNNNDDDKNNNNNNKKNNSDDNNHDDDDDDDDNNNNNRKENNNNNNSNNNNSSNNNINNNIISVKAPEGNYDCDRISSVPVREGSEDSPSDSSYDCKISITLNTVLNPKEIETENESQGYETYCLKENCNSQTTMSLEESSSHVTDIKTETTKKESEMSLKMKRKLLEILEGEIKKEMGFGVSSGNSSEGLGLKARDSEVNLRSQSTESSTDNIETLAQLSNTMRQYLTYLRDMKELPNKSKEYGKF